MIKKTWIGVVLTLLLTACNNVVTNENPVSPPTGSSPNTSNSAPAATSNDPKMAGMLEAHNKARSAKGLAPLSWSNSLAAHAKEWANYLATRNSCLMKHRPHSGEFQRKYGENIFWASPTRWSDGRVEVQNRSANDIVFAWVDEENDYDYSSNTCKPGKMCGHYTQVVWHDTTQVGCAMTICPDKGQMWVCNYNPPGNYIGEKPY